jgi:hypothetical protein
VSERRDEPLLGWRIWLVDRGRLSAVVWGSEWPPRARFTATCEHAPASFWRVDPASDNVSLAGFGGGAQEPHAAPDAGCECGVYAFARREDAELLAAEKSGGGAVLALGRVSLWGRVVVTERGYRAELAYPYDLEVLGCDDELVRELRAAYAVDVAAAPAVASLHAATGSG